MIIFYLKTIKLVTSLKFIAISYIQSKNGICCFFQVLHKFEFFFTAIFSFRIEKSLMIKASTGNSLRRVKNTA